MKVCLLPKYGEENPYQILTLKGLKKSGIDAFFGRKVGFLPIIYNYYKFKPDWIHLDWIYFAYQVNLPIFFKWSFLYLFKFQLLCIKKITNCKVAYTLHNIEGHEKYNVRIDMLAQKFIFKYADFVRIFSENTKLKVKERWGNINLKKFIVQPEGSYIDYYPNTISFEQARKKLGYTTSDFLILFLGSIRRYKGVLELIESFLEVKENNWKLLIAGYRYDKEYCDLIEKKCFGRESIKIVFGHQKEEDLQVYFNASNVVALPFKKIENSGSVILAMGFSKPILAPKLGVLIDKLDQQEEILFNNSVKESLLIVKEKSLEQIKAIGEKNYMVAKTYDWKYFANFFMQ